jgi:hypothetical protein
MRSFLQSSMMIAGVGPGARWTATTWDSQPRDSASADKASAEEKHQPCKEHVGQLGNVQELTSTFTL